MDGLLTAQDMVGALDEFKGPAPEPVFEAPAEPAPQQTPLLKNFDQVVKESQDEEDVSTAKALEAARVENPELYRRALKNAQLDGLPVDTIWRNLDQVEQGERYDRLRSVLRRNKGLNDWFQQADNNKTVSVENLESMDSASWMLKAGGRALETGNAQVEIADLRWKEMWGFATPGEVARADQLEADMSDDFGTKSWVGQGFTGALQQLPILGETAGAAFEGYVTGGAAGLAGGFAIGGPAGALAGMQAVGGPTAAVYAGGESFKLNSALTFSEIRGFRTPDGKRIDLNTARGASFIAGLPMAALDTLSLGKFFEASGLGAMVKNQGVKAAVREALKNETFRQVAFAVGKRFAGAVGVETITETLQESIQVAAGEIAKSMSGKGNGPDQFTAISSNEFWTRMGETAKQTALSTVFISGLPAGGRLYIDYAASRQSETDTFKLNQLTEVAKNDPLLKEDPEKAAEVLAASLEGSDKDTVYLDTDAVREFLQADGVEAQALSKLPNFQEALTEAVRSGGDVAIPTAAFYAYVAPTDAAASIIDRLKFSPEGMSKKQAEMFVKALEKIKKEGLEAQPSGSVYADMYEKSRNVGYTPDQARQHATLYSAFFDSMGQQTGKDPYEIYSSYNVDIENVSATPPKGPVALEVAAKRHNMRVLKAFANGVETDKIKLSPMKGPPAPGRIASVQVTMKGSNDTIELAHLPGSDRLYASAAQAEGKGKEFYDAIEDAVGQKLQPDPFDLSPEAYKFWKKRAPDELVDYVQDEDGHWHHKGVKSFNQAEAQDGPAYEKLRRVASWKDISTVVHEMGQNEIGLVVSPAGNIYALDNHMVHAEWGRLHSDGGDAIRVTGYWSGRTGEFIWGARFNEGRLTQPQYRSIQRLASATDQKMSQLVTNTIGSEMPGKYANENVIEFYPLEGAFSDTPTTSFMDYIKANPPIQAEFKQGDGAAIVRGSITFAGDKTLIKLFRDANLSTVLHETGHFFLQVMADLASGEKGYAQTLFQEDEIQVGDVVQLLDAKGKNLLKAPAAIVAITKSLISGTMVQVEGNKRKYKANRAVIISRGSNKVEEAEVETKPYEDAKVGDLVWPLSAPPELARITETPVRVTGVFTDPIHGTYGFVEGSGTGLPIAQFQVVERSKDKTTKPEFADNFLAMMKELQFKPNSFREFPALNDVSDDEFLALSTQAMKDSLLTFEEGRMWRTMKEIPEDYIDTLRNIVVEPAEEADKKLAAERTAAETKQEEAVAKQTKDVAEQFDEALTSEDPNAWMDVLIKFEGTNEQLVEALKKVTSGPNAAVIKASPAFINVEAFLDTMEPEQEPKAEVVEPTTRGVKPTLEEEKADDKLASEIAEGPLPDAGVAPSDEYLHGGTFKGGDVEDAVFLTKDPAFAESYVTMAKERGAEDAAVQRVRMSLKSEAPLSGVKAAAKRAGIDTAHVTPASWFDKALSGEEAVKKLVNELRSKGYDHAILEDVPYGTGAKAQKVTVAFPEKKGSPAEEVELLDDVAGIPEDPRSFEQLRFELAVSQNSGFATFIEGKPQSTDQEKEQLRHEYWPNSKEPNAKRQSEAHRAQNESDEGRAAVKEIQKAKRAKEVEEKQAAELAELAKDPLYVAKDVAAQATAQEAVKRVSDIIKATQNISTAVSKAHGYRIAHELHLNLKTVPKDAEFDAAWAELQAEIEAINPENHRPGATVKEVVQTYINKYKKAQKQEQLTKEAGERKAKREGDSATKKISAQEIKEAITELAEVVDRVEKVVIQREVNEQLKADVDIINAWLGEKGPQYSTEAQEKFAKAFEVYLAEGIAPTPSLARAFERFKEWLKLVYRKITNVGTAASPEVKAVFDRMLTVDQTIANEVSSTAFKPAFSSAEEAGMTPVEFAAYLQNVGSIAQVGKQAASQAVMAEANKLRTQAMAEKKHELRMKYTEEMGATRVYRVLGYLQGKKIEGLDPVKLDRQKVIETLGPKQLGTIPNGAKLWDKMGGVDPDTVAHMFGWPSGADMLAEFQNTEPLKIAVDKRVNAEVDQLSEQQLVIPADVQEMAAAKLRSEVYRTFLKTEIRAFSKLMGIDFTEAHVVQFQRMAEEIIDAKPVRTILRRSFVREYTAADIKIGKLLDSAIKRKAIQEILDLRRKQLLNHFLITTAYATKEKSRTAKEYLTSFTKKKADVIDQDYLSQIRNLLIGFEFVKGQMDPTASSLSQFLDEEIDAGNMIVVDPSIKKREAKAWMSLTWGELSTIHDAVKNLEFVGRNRRKIFKEGKVLDMRKAVGLITANMDRFLRKPPRRDTLNPGRRNWWGSLVNGYVNSHVKIEQLCDWLDGGAAQGPAHKYIFQPFADAQAKEVALSRKMSDKIVNIIERKDAFYWDRVFRIKELNISMKRSEVMAVALNLGNESNAKKLKKGMTWTDTQVDAITSLLSKEDWTAVQDIWDTIHELWPSVLEVAARTGIPRPDVVRPVAITNKHGTFKGGYYPIVYDPSKSADVLSRGLTTKAEQDFGFQPSTIFPPKSFANDRTDEYARPIMLDMRVLPQHIKKVTHYVTHAEALGNVKKIMNHTEFKDRLLSQFGETMYTSMVGWLANISKGEMEVAGLSGYDKFFKTMRSNITLAALGFRATTVIAQAGGFFAGAEMIGMGTAASGMKAVYGSGSMQSIKDNWAFIRERSNEMRYRGQFLERDLASIGDVMSSSVLGKIKNKYREVAMVPIIVADNILSSGIWMGAYNKQMSANPHDEATAIAYADKVIRLTQGSGGAKDLAAIQRGNEFYRLMTMFYTYFSAYQNRLLDIARTAQYRFDKTGAEGYADSPMRPNELVRYVYAVVLPAVIFDFMFKGMLKGDFNDGDPNTGDPFDAFWKTFAYTFAGSAGIRDLAAYVTRDKEHWKFQGSPLLRTIEQTLDRTDRVVRAAFDEKKDQKYSDVSRSVSDLIGLTTGLPTDALSTPLQNYLKVQELGEQFSPADFFTKR